VNPLVAELRALEAHRLELAGGGMTLRSSVVRARGEVLDDRVSESALA
jgi:hypothetical protein